MPKLEEMPHDGADEIAARNQRAWSTYLNFNAPPSEEGAVVNQRLETVPSLFPDSDQPVLCPKCGVRSGLTTDVVDAKAIKCWVCEETYHYFCAGIVKEPAFVMWLCEGCRVAARQAKKARR